VYTSDVPCDIDAVVLSNTRLADDYSVLALAAPEIADLARPGQFVMVKPSRGGDPLLRRPFSIFEILRGPDRSTRGISLLNKRVGAGTGLLYDAAPGARVTCLGPLGRPFEPVDPPMQAWMIAGGVGLAPFLTLAEALVARGTPTTLFYGARRGSELYYADSFEAIGVRTVLSTEDGSRGARGFITVPLTDALAALGPDEAIKLYVCGPTMMMRAVAKLAGLHGQACDVSLEQVMGCGLGGCYSCVVLTRQPGGPPHFVRSCLEGPVFDAGHIVWDALAH
jgi:dihydroorotate dehydrogenase electron transfer subunit